MTDSLFVYCTAPSFEDAHEIALAVVGEGLAACVNILSGATSVYRWEDAVQEEQEVVFILKTRKDAFEALAGRIRQMHPYTCPCIVGLPIDQGDAEFLSWIRRSVTFKKDKR